ncbi:uncharacterized protein PG986_008666 [Apiospora aurea]|uniref:Uncharacterized protein n=1 Tax=Apiospora aurea TaxID=335848 RepID=A0ABR1Q5H9_9PEZI
MGNLKFRGGVVDAAVAPGKKYLVWAYEASLASHVVLSAMALIGSILHIIYRYGWPRWEYQTWTVVGLGVWGLDRLVARPVRIVRNGLRREAEVSVFPVLELARVGKSPVLRRSGGRIPPRGNPCLSASKLGFGFFVTWARREKRTQCRWSCERPNRLSKWTWHIVFIVRRRGGLTAKLRKHAGDSQRLRVLVGSCYGTTRDMVWGHANVSVSVGKRFDFGSVLEAAVGRMSGGTTVAVCGPPDLADEIICIVVGLGKGG